MSEDLVAPDEPAHLECPQKECGARMDQVEPADPNRHKVGYRCTAEPEDHVEIHLRHGQEVGTDHDLVWEEE